MRVWSSLFVPGGGTRRQVRAAAARRAPRRLTPSSSRPPASICPPGPRSRASDLAVMEARPAGGARRKGAAAGPGEGWSLPQAAARRARDGVCGARGHSRARSLRAAACTGGGVGGANGWEPGRGAWRSGRAVRPRRDLGEIAGAQPRGAVEAAALPRAGGSGSLAPPASLGSSKSRAAGGPAHGAAGSGVMQSRGVRIGSGWRESLLSERSSLAGAPHTDPAPCRGPRRTFSALKLLTEQLAPGRSQFEQEGVKRAGRTPSPLYHLCPGGSGTSGCAPGG